MAAGCREKLDWKFIKFIVTTYKRRKKEMAERLSQFKTEGKRVIVLKNTRDIDSFLNNLDGRTDKAL